MVLMVSKVAVPILWRQVAMQVKDPEYWFSLVVTSAVLLMGQLRLPFSASFRWDWFLSVHLLPV
jgi:hypothetical protein